MKDLYLHKRNVHKLKTREYMCNQCDFTATARHSLARHVELIHDKVEYKCETCSYKTNMKFNLKMHTSRQHSVTGMFHCEQCNYSSRQKIHLDIHKKSKHEGEVLLCHLCSYKASQLSNLKRHQNSKHSEMWFGKMLNRKNYNSIKKVNFKELNLTKLTSMEIIVQF